MEKQYIDLVFGGAGPVRYPVYVGILEALAKKGYIPNRIDHTSNVRQPRLCGTSAGALVGGLYMAGLPITREKGMKKNDLTLKNLVLDTPSTTFASMSLIKFIKAFLLYRMSFGGAYMNSGKKIEKWIDEKLDRVKMKDIKNLFIVATDVTNQENVIINGTSFPEMSLARAIRASISIPFVFNGVKENFHGRKVLLMDGGLRYNFPVDYFYNLDHTPVVGFFMENSSLKKLNSDPTIFDIIKMSIANMIGATETKSMEDASYASIISIDDGDGSDSDLMKFESSREIREKWVAKGFEVAYSMIDQAVEESRERIFQPS